MFRPVQPRRIFEETKKSLELALREAITFQNAENHLKVIELLEPFEQSSHIELLDTLGISCISEWEASNRPDLRSKALSIYNKLFAHVNKLEQPDLLLKTDILYKICICYKNTTKTLEHFTQQALQVVDKYKIENPSTKESINDIHYLICFNAANCYSAAMTKATVDFAKQSTFFKTAEEYFKKALEIKIELKCLLSYARLISTRGTKSALKILQIHEQKYNKDPDYNFCMQQLCEISGYKAVAREYEQKHIKLPKHPELTKIFSDLYGTESPLDDSPSEKISVAAMLLHKGSTDEAKKITDSILLEHPNYIEALRLAVMIESKAGNNLQTINELCDTILKIDPTSIFAMLYKADVLWEWGTEDNLKKANELYEKAFDQGFYDNISIKRLIRFNTENTVKLTHLLHSLENAQHLLPETHFIIAHGYLRLGEYQKAVDAFNKLRVLDRYYKHNQTALGVIYSSFHLAKTKEDYTKCAKKLRSYFSRLESNERDSVDEEMLKELQAYFDLSETSTPTNQEVKQEAQELKKVDLLVPEDVKAKVLELLKSKNSCIFDKFAKEREDKNSDRSKEIPEKLYPIGDPKNNLFGYIAANAKFSSEKTAVKFQKALESKNLLSSDSEGIAGSKKLENGRWSLKIAGSGKRMLSTGIFSLPHREKPNEMMTAVKYGKEVVHSRLNK